MTPLKNQYGSVKPYTRHQSSCPHKNTRDHNDCLCPKWLYANQRGAKPCRYSLTTPSWADAMTKGTEVLRGFDPEIAAARVLSAQKQRQAVTIRDAVELWLDRTEHMCGARGTYRQYRALLRKLIHYVDRWNVGKPEAERKVFIDQLDSAFCTQWYHSWKYSNSAMRQRWGVIRSFFNYLQQQGAITSNPALSIKAVPKEHIYLNVPFTDQQYNDILNCVTADHPRLRAFVELLRWTGMDIGDAIQFRPSMIDRDGVLRYIRTKTRVQAVIPLSAHMVELLREIPLAPHSVPDMPLRTRGIDLASDYTSWSRAIRGAMAAAGVERVQLVEKSGVPAYDRNGNPIMKSTNVKAFRHTFAVGWLTAGADKETVAKMLGHTSTVMIDAHYGPWGKGRDDAHVRRVRALMGEVKLKKSLKVVTSGGREVSSASH